MTTLRLGATLAALLVVASCRDADFDRAVRRALLCEDCDAGQIDSLVAYETRAVPRLAIEARGPSRSDTRRLESLLNAEWRSIRAQRPLASAADSARMVTRSLDAFATSYQKRALFALYRIGTAEARQVIEQTYQADSLGAGSILRPGARRLADSLRHLP